MTPASPLPVPVLDEVGMRQFLALRSAAADAVARRFFEQHAADYAQFDDKGRETCREDLCFHLDFLRPVLEFGLVEPMVDYLRWLETVLASRDVPVAHLPLSLEWLAEFFASHMDGPNGAAVSMALNQVCIRFREPVRTDPAIYGLLPAEWPESGDLQERLLAGDRGAVDRILKSRLDAGHGLLDAELHLIQPALYRIGRKWQHNEVTVGQEHIATAIAQSAMARGLMQATMAPANGRKVLLACVEGNQHAVGLQMVADAFQLAGWEVQYLGANVPTTALLQQVTTFQPDLVGLSVAFAHQLRVVRQVMARLAADTRTAALPVMIGGLAINQFSAIADELGASGWSPDAGAALDLAARLAPRP